MPEQELPFPPPTGEYGSKGNGREEAYLSHIYVYALRVLGKRGAIDGSESVDRVYELMEQTERGKEMARLSRERYGDGNIALNELREAGYEITPEIERRYYRTNIPCAKVFPPYIFNENKDL